jgi:hypothetical protein
MVGATLNLASKFTANEISGLIFFVRYINVPMTLRYGYSDPNTSSPFFPWLK